MRYNSVSDHTLLRRAAQGPAALTGWRQAPLPVPGRGLQGLSHHRGSRVSYRGLGYLGTGTTGSVGSGAAAGAAAGSVAGPIGTVVGGVIGAVAGLFGGKSNPQIQIDKNTANTLYSQYVNVAGTVSGRSIGINNMDMVLRGACFAGHFPGWGSKTELPDSLLSMPGSPYGQNDNCFAVLWQAAKTGNPAPGGSGKYTGNNGVPVRDALTFVNNYVWPSNSANVDTDPWVTNTDSVGKQIIIDCADAYIAVQDPTTNVTIGQTVSAPAVNLPATPATSSATPSPTPTAGNLSPAGSYLTAGTPGTLVTAAGTWTLTSSGAYQLNGATVASIPSATAVGTVGLLYMNGQVYAYNSDGGTFAWNGSAWQATTAVPTPPAAITALIPAAAASTVSTTPPAIGASITYAMDAATGKMVAIPAGGVYAGLSPNGYWLITYTGTNAGTYYVSNGMMTQYTGASTATSGAIPAGYTLTSQSALISGTTYPLYADASGNLYVWLGGQMVPYSTAASNTTSTGLVSSGGGGGGYYATPTSPTSSPAVVTSPVTSGIDPMVLLGGAALGAWLLFGRKS